jgi:hypothetical protein
MANILNTLLSFRTHRKSQACANKNTTLKGIALVWVAITLVALLVFMGISIDASVYFLTKHQLQNAADAAALAGAIYVKADPCTAVTKAVQFASYNTAFGQAVAVDPNAGEVVLGVYNPDPYPGTFQPSSGFANAVKVETCRTRASHGPIPLFFMPILGFSTADVNAVAIAMASGGTGAGLIALDCGGSCGSPYTRPGPCGGSIPGGPSKGGHPGLEMEGGSIVDVGGGPVLGEVVVNCANCGHPRDAVDLGGGSIIEDAAQMNIVGCYYGPETDYPIMQDDPCNFMPDPLGCWPNPENCIMPQIGPDPEHDLSPDPNICAPWKPDPCSADANGWNTLKPGYYSGGISVTSATAKVRLEPGIYVVDGQIGTNVSVKGGLQLTGGTIDASGGVMFYILGGSVNIGGGVNLTATELVPWNDDGTILTYEGMLIYQDPDNCTPARIIGTSDLTLVGTIYFPFNQVEIGGDGYAVGTQLIANSVWVHTSGEGVLINYDGRFRAPGNRSFLVR